MTNLQREKVVPAMLHGPAALGRLGQHLTVVPVAEQKHFPHGQEARGGRGWPTALQGHTPSHPKTPPEGSTTSQYHGGWPFPRGLKTQTHLKAPFWGTEEAVSTVRRRHRAWSPGCGKGVTSSHPPPCLPGPAWPRGLQDPTVGHSVLKNHVSKPKPLVPVKRPWYEESWRSRST